MLHPGVGEDFPRGGLCPALVDEEAAEAGPHDAALPHQQALVGRRLERVGRLLVLVARRGSPVDPLQHQVLVPLAGLFPPFHDDHAYAALRYHGAARHAVLLGVHVHLEARLGMRQAADLVDGDDRLQRVGVFEELPLLLLAALRGSQLASDVPVDVGLLALRRGAADLHLELRGVLGGLRAEDLHQVAHLDLGLGGLDQALPDHLLPVPFLGEPALRPQLLLLLLRQLQGLWGRRSRLRGGLDGERMLYVYVDLFQVQLLIGAVAVHS